MDIHSRRAVPNARHKSPAKGGLCGSLRRRHKIVTAGDGQASMLREGTAVRAGGMEA
jgi:hypothetical protein